MSERVWHKGPPPFPGWWNASIKNNEECWRWWDGGAWSEAAYEDYSPWLADLTARLKTPYNKVEWTDYWPENARVPRLDPTGGHWTFNVDGLEPKSLAKQIDIAWRNGRIDRRCGSRHWRWSLSGCTGDILAWRPAA